MEKEDADSKMPFSFARTMTSSHSPEFKLQGNPRVLITGASGFIGSFLVRESVKRGWETYAGVRTSSSREHLLTEDVQYFQVDLGHIEVLRGDLERFAAEKGGFDYVIHNAGVTKPRSPADFEQGNAIFTGHFAQMLRDSQPRLSRFVYMSSLAALGPGDPESLAPIAEDQDPKPLTPYARSKRLAEQLLQDIEEFPYVILRPSAVYGPRDWKFMKRILGILEHGWEIHLGPRRQALSFIHAADLAWVAAEVCQAPVEREAFNLSDGMSYNQEQFNRIVRSVIGKRTVTVRFPTWILLTVGFLSLYSSRLLGKPVHLSHYKMREVTARNWNADITKASEMLGYTPHFMLPEGIADAVQWFKA